MTDSAAPRESDPPTSPSDLSFSVFTYLSRVHSTKNPLDRVRTISVTTRPPSGRVPPDRFVYAAGPAARSKDCGGKSRPNVLTNEVSNQDLLDTVVAFQLATIMAGCVNLQQIILEDNTPQNQMLKIMIQKGRPDVEVRVGE